jgi:phosphopantothenoylcysteine decarboxylase/phosphopantothenate--cysteine ligase
VVETPTVESMLEAALARADVDLVLMAAAPADYRPVARDEGKRPKDEAAWTIELEPTPDVLLSLGERKRPGQVLVGFAADHGERGLERAREKLVRKRADLIVFNDVSRTDIGFDARENEVVVVGPDGEHPLAKASKDAIAGAILDLATPLLEREPSPTA